MKSLLSRVGTARHCAIATDVLLQFSDCALFAKAAHKADVKSKSTLQKSFGVSASQTMIFHLQKATNVGTG